MYLVYNIIMAFNFFYVSVWKRKSAKGFVQFTLKNPFLG